MKTCPFADRLGRYEYVNKGENSDKQWTVEFNTKTGFYSVNWGRRGATPQYQHGLTAVEAYKRINEKIAKGYQHVLVSNSKLSPLAHERMKKISSETPRNRKRLKKEEKSEAFDFAKELRKL